MDESTNPIPADPAAPQPAPAGQNTPQPAPAATVTAAFPQPVGGPPEPPPAVGADAWAQQPGWAQQPSSTQAGWPGPTLPGPQPQSAPQQGPGTGPQTAPWPRTYAPLTRSRSDRMIGGVCGGLARYWNTDPVLLRILTVVLSLATGGAFVLVYLVAWLLIRDDPAGFYPPSGAGYAGGGNPGYGTPGTANYLAPDGYPAGYQTAPPRERSYLGWLTLSAAVLFAGVMGLVALFAPSGVAVAAITSAGMLTILGIGLLVGAVRGRARWLVIPAIPLAFIAMGAVSASNWVADNPDWRAVAGSGISAGDRTWKVTPTAAKGGNLNYRLGVGEATLDLTGLGAPAVGSGQPVPISVSIGLGQLTVIVPRDVEVQLEAQIQAGEVVLPKTRTTVSGGAQTGSPQGNPDRGSLSGSNIDLSATVSPVAEKPNYVIELDAAIGAGTLEVRREAA